LPGALEATGSDVVLALTGGLNAVWASSVAAVRVKAERAARAKLKDFIGEAGN
jgi:hypothetical protein